MRRVLRVQFSLRGLLLFVLLIAMATALFVTGRRLRQAEAELAKYRREYGILEVKDSAMLQAIALWTGEPRHWRWRVHFPRGRYNVCFATIGIPAGGIPAPAGELNSDFTGVVDISVSAYKDPKDSSWRYAITSGGYQRYADMPVPPLTRARGRRMDRSIGATAPLSSRPRHRSSCCGNGRGGGEKTRWMSPNRMMD